MKIFISLDYELFLSTPATDIHYSLINPSQRFYNLLNKYNVKSVFFVDAGYLFALKRQKDKYKKLDDDYNKVVQQLQYFNSQKHEIGLHVHPHWEDSFFDGNKWVMDLKRYKLADFKKEEAEMIFKKYYELLQSFISEPIIAYRAGGWCLEPFSHIREAMAECGIYLDSTVYRGGYSKTATHSYNFRHYPQKDSWRFSADPSIEDPDGYFWEVPSTAYQLSPLLYWKVMLNTILKKTKGIDSGKPVKPSMKDVLNKLFLKTTHAVSIDSVKSDLLLQTFKSKEEKGDEYFSVMGHPKCFSERTYINLIHFIEYALSRGHSFSTFSESFQNTNKQKSWINALTLLIISFFYDG